MLVCETSKGGQQSERQQEKKAAAARTHVDFVLLESFPEVVEDERLVHLVQQHQVTHETAQRRPRDRVQLVVARNQVRLRACGPANRWTDQHSRNTAANQQRVLTRPSSVSSSILASKTSATRAGTNAC